MRKKMKLEPFQLSCVCRFWTTWTPRRIFKDAYFFRNFSSLHTHSTHVCISQLLKIRQSSILLQLHAFFIFSNSPYRIPWKTITRPMYFLSLFALTVLLLTFHVSAVPFGKPLDTYPQLQAQAACVAEKADRSGWHSAIPRKCSGQVTCETICKGLPLHAPDSQRRDAKNHVCLNSFHLYNQGFSKKEHMAGLKTYKYNSCKSAGCGPNFCCCISY